MPALPPVAKAARVVLHGLQMGTKPWVNAFHLGYSIGSSLTLAEVTTIANNVSTAWIGNIAPQVSDTLELAGVIATALDSPTAPTFENTTTHAGGAPDEPLNAGTAMVIQRKVGRRYRGGHSRVYLPGMLAGALNDDTEEWDPTTLASFVSLWAAVEDAAVGAINGTHTDAASTNISYWEGFTNVLYPSGRYHAKPNARPGGPLVDIVTGFAGNPKPCSQRRRQQP